MAEQFACASRDNPTIRVIHEFLQIGSVSRKRDLPRRQRVPLLANMVGAGVIMA